MKLKDAKEILAGTVRAHMECDCWIERRTGKMSATRFYLRLTRDDLNKALRFLAGEKMFNQPPATGERSNQ